MKSRNELTVKINKYPPTPIGELIATGVTDAIIVANIITVVLAILTHLPISISGMYNQITGPYETPNMNVNNIINIFSNYLSSMYSLITNSPRITEIIIYPQTNIVLRPSLSTIYDAIKLEINNTIALISDNICAFF